MQQIVLNKTSHYNKYLEDFRLKQYRLNVYRNISKDIGSKFVNKQVTTLNPR